MVEAHEIKRKKQPNYNHIPDEILFDLYVNQRLNTHAIAKKLGISQSQAYVKIKRLGIIDSSRKLICKKGEIGRKLIDNDGYVKIFLPDNPNAQSSGWVLEHRLIMSKHLNRPLLLREVVHHKNGIKTDNQIDNLEVFSSPGQHSASRHRPAIPNDQLLNDLKALYWKLNRPLKHYDLTKENNVVTYETYRVRFGSFKRACELAKGGSRLAPPML
jgi:hypothetical protein